MHIKNIGCIRVLTNNKKYAKMHSYDKNIREHIKNAV
jgi:hypothetical protein